MGRITLDSGREDLGAFPASFEVVARDDLGDVLAVDAKGKVWNFAHGAGDWERRTLAFATVALLHEHIAFQDRFALPPYDADLAALHERKNAIEAFLEDRSAAPYSEEDADAALEQLRSEIADRRFWSSRRGKGLAECQELGQRCEQALRAAGAPGQWISRAQVGDGRVLGVVGDFAPPWTEQRVTELLTPLIGKHKLVCKKRPPPAARS